jgi:hypothetical protein
MHPVEPIEKLEIDANRRQDPWIGAAVPCGLIGENDDVSQTIIVDIVRNQPRMTWDPDLCILVIVTGGGISEPYGECSRGPITHGLIRQYEVLVSVGVDADEYHIAIADAGEISISSGGLGEGPGARRVEEGRDGNGNEQDGE